MSMGDSFFHIPNSMVYLLCVLLSVIYVPQKLILENCGLHYRHVYQTCL